LVTSAENRSDVGVSSTYKIIAPSFFEKGGGEMNPSTPDEALGEYLVTTSICGNFVDVYHVTRRLGDQLHVNPDDKSEFVQRWMGYLVGYVRGHSYLTLGHSSRHSDTMPWGACRHCLERAFGETEFEALEIAVSRMITMLR
jgi:hypothetical protein